MKREYDDINTYVFSVIPSGSSILDIGCATGMLGKYIRALKNPQRLVGVDINYKSLRKARRYYDRVIAVDIEKHISLPLKQKFDCIVCADVLEHLKDPGRLLQMALKYLEKDGIIIISVPNAVFILERLVFILGKYDYIETGLRDKTHLRLFTYKSIQSLVRQAGYIIDTKIGYLNTRTFIRFLNPLARFYPPLFGRQLLLVCRHRASE